MQDANDELAVLRRVNGNLQGQFERMVEHDQQTVRRVLTEPGRLAEWLAPGTIELHLGGTAKLNFIDSRTVIDSMITAFDPPRLIEYSWSSGDDPLRPVRWETSPADSGTHLSLTITLPQNEDIARACAGWEAHLMMLLAALEGVPIKFPFEHFKRTREAYKAKLASLGRS
jgi:uncharacterized protein YndB with AHSA1/START domain